MDSFRNGLRILCLLVVCAALNASHAGERCDIVYVNRTDEEILAIRGRYATPHDEPRHDYSRKNLPPDGEFRLGIQGVTLPELILIDFAAKSYVFPDLSGLNPANAMVLAIVREDGKPILRRLDAEGEVEGGEREYLSAANRPNAVDKQALAAASTADLLEGLLHARIEEARKELGEVERFDVEAGPIWSQDHALERCPEVAREWSEENGRPARWTGHWLTTIPNEMSVCNCMTGTADEDGTITVENDGWGTTAYFPITWRGHYGVGVASEPRREGDGDNLPIALRFRLPVGGQASFLDGLLGDLRLDGYRPARLVVETWAGQDAGDDEEDTIDIDFRQEDDAPWSIYAIVMEVLADAYEMDRLDGKLFWVEADAFKPAKPGAAEKPIRGAFCSFSKGIFEIILMPDVRDVWEALQEAADAED